MTRNIFSGFYKKTYEERNQFIKEWMGNPNYPSLPKLAPEVANQLIENYIGNYELPLGIAVNISVNQKTYLVPMAIEEPSVIAAVSNGGKILGNIQAKTETRELIGQIIFETEINLNEAVQRLDSHRSELLKYAKELSASMVRRGGGPKQIWIEEKCEDNHCYKSLYLSFNSCDAMGANVMNSILEALEDKVASIFDADILMSILSNYQEENLTQAQACVKIESLDSDPTKAIELAYAIEKACRYANLDIYRAVTHNKGVMNGVDAVLLATGNDWRAVEAGGHAFAARSGQYQTLTHWRVDENNANLIGKIQIPLQVATVGGTLSSHPTAKWALELMQLKDAKEFANVIASIGLIQNFSALRALVGEGIQKGHMAMQARALALRVGAQVHEVDQVVTGLKQVKIMNQATALKILQEIRQQ